MEIEVEMEFERETKNTFRYSEIARDKPPVVGSLYIQKWALSDRPDRISVVIRADSKK